MCPNGGRPAYLEEAYIREANRFVGLREDQLSAVLHDLRRIAADNELTRLAVTWRDALFTHELPFYPEHVEQWDIPPHAPLLPVIVLLAGLSPLRRYYTKAGIAEKILSDTLFDVSRNLDEIKARHGRYIMESPIFEWLARHFTARLFHLGRLQFEPEPIEEDNTLLQKGDWVLNTHIPSGGRLPHEDILASYRQAIVFFAKLRPELPLKGFVCGSWMLSPQLRELLDESSNLVQFLNDYDLYGTENDEDSFFTYIFIRKPDDLRALPENSTLQRTVKRYLLSGGKLMAGRGFIPFQRIIAQNTRAGAEGGT